MTELQKFQRLIEDSLWSSEPWLHSQILYREFIRTKINALRGVRIVVKINF